LVFGSFKHCVFESENDEDYNAAVDIAFNITHDHGHWKKSMNIQRYTLEDALYESSIFKVRFALIEYNPPIDTFLGLYNKNQRLTGNKKLWKSMRCLTFMLRKVFPERFNKNMPELVLAISSGDSPQVDKWKLLQHSDGVVPVLMFGSSFHDTNVYKWSRCQCHCRVSIRIASFNGRNPMENNCARVYVWCLVKRKICNGIC
jgi:hypothetical protein